MGNLSRGLISFTFSRAAFILFWISFACSRIINHHYFDDSLKRVAYRAAIPYGPLQCGILCSLEGRCESVNYHMKSLICELVETSASNVSDSEGWVSTSDLSFVDEMLGSCASVNITEVSLCARLRNGGNAHLAKYCPVPTSVSNGNVTLDNRNIGDIITYTCDYCYNLNGSSNYTCQSDGQWSAGNVQCIYPARDEIRVVNGNQYSGRVEVLHNGTWGTICDDNWANVDAKVACRQLGYSGGEFTREASFGQGSGPIWMDSMDCSGNECKLSDCSFPGWGVHDCQHNEDAGVVCIGD